MSEILDVYESSGRPMAPADRSRMALLNFDDLANSIASGYVSDQRDDDDLGDDDDLADLAAHSLRHPGEMENAVQ